ncbi:MAG: hypothetical protein WA364_13270 [Candidatus Nitrosopolaris sp.]
MISPCSDLVNPDNTLTQQGKHVKGCIQNGAVLAGAALLLGFPPTAILSTLPMIAQRRALTAGYAPFNKQDLRQIWERP